jgi:hypothetical protein
MHLCGPALTTTGKKKGKKKFASAEHKRKAEQLDQEWKDLQKRWGVEADNRKRAKGLASPVWQPEKIAYRGSSEPKIPSLNSGLGVAILAPAKVYTGTKVKGIATMHKSNAVPVFSDEEAVDISRMRR